MKNLVKNLFKCREQQCNIHNVVRSLRYSKPDKNGWSFDYKFIKKTAERAQQYDDGVSMEDVEAVLCALSD